MAMDLADPIGAPCAGTIGFPNLPIVHMNSALGGSRWAT